MADYYSLLSKAVGNLPKSSPPSARKAIYDRARAALIRQLRSLGPALSEADIVREEAALEAAVARLEGQFAPGASPPPASRLAEPARPSTAAAALTPQRPATVLPPTAGVQAPSAAGVQPPSTARVQAPLATNPPLRPPAPRTPGAPTMETPLRPPPPADPAARPILGARAAPPPPIAQRFPPASEASAAPPIVAAAGAHYDIDNRAPAVHAGADGDRGTYGPASDGESMRPTAPSRFEKPRANPLPWIVFAVVIGLVFSIAVAAFLLRQKPQDLAIKEPAATTDVKPAADAPKIVERVGGADQTPTPTPTPASSAAPPPAPAASVTPSPAASSDGAAANPTPTETPAAAPTPAASSAATATPQPPTATPNLPVAARAAMLVAVGSDPQKPPAVSLGSVVWSSIPPAPGQPGTVAVKAEADIPELKMHAVMTIRKNTDASLPATHTVDLRVTFADGADIKGIKDMRVPLMRRDDPPTQDSLAGVRVKISDSYFLVGLNRSDADTAHNLDLIANRPWFDFPMLLNDDRIAKLTFEKGADGERVLNDALAAWKGP